MNAVIDNKDLLNSPEKKPTLKKYRAIIISVALFILLDASVLIANFWLSFQIEKDATAVNIAGRQRMLSQRISKSLYDISLIQNSSADKVEIQERNKELDKSISLFDTTIYSFKNGGSVLGTAGKPVTLDALTTPETIGYTDLGIEIWSVYKEGLTTFVNEHKNGNLLYSDIKLQEYSRENNVKLLSLMNSLTTELAVIAKSKANLLRQIQVFGILLAFINFLIVTFHFLRKLGESDRQVAAAQQQTDQILETVDEGLFLVDDELTIGNQHSNRLLDIFGKQSVKGQNLTEFLEDMVSSKDKNTTQEYFKLLFDKRKKESLIGDLNPLKEIPVQIKDENTSNKKDKHLRFAFKRVEEKGEISKILTTVSDITNEVALREELKRIENESNEQMDILGVILGVNPKMMDSFLDNAKESYTSINKKLKHETSSTSGYVEKINKTLRVMHKIKGEANALKVSVISDLAHKFEVDALKLRDEEVIGGQDFIPLTVTLDKMISYTEKLSSLHERINAQGNTTNITINEENTQTSDIQTSWKHLYDLADAVADRQNKNVELVISGFNDYLLPEKMTDYINTISTQLIRNSIVHGIENEKGRIALQKDKTGLISINLNKRKDDQLYIEFKDDGAGISADAIREKAVALNLVSEEASLSMQPYEVISFLFHSGFSISDEADQDHGHGIGMALVKEKTSDLNGKIRINTKKGQGTKFTFSIPLTSS